MTIGRAVDASYDLLTVEEAQCLKKNGTVLFVQCLWTAVERPASAILSLRNAHNAGLRIAGYASLNQYGSGVGHMNSGRAGVPDDLWKAMEFVAVDIERNNIRIGEIVAAVNRVKAFGQRPILYTNYNSWTTKVIPRNPDDVARMGVPLWNAYWDENPDIDFPRLRFGGWQDGQVMIEQYTGGTYVCGTFVDQNSVVLELLNEGGEDEMTEKEREQLAELAALMPLVRLDAVIGKNRSGRNEDRIEEVFVYGNNIDKAILTEQSSILAELKQTQQGLMNTAAMLIEHLDPFKRSTLSSLAFEALEEEVKVQGEALAGAEDRLEALIDGLRDATEGGEA